MNNILPEYWCNFLSDYPDIYYKTILSIDKKLLPYNKNLNIAPKQPLSLMRQSHNISDKNVLIPEELRKIYAQYRPTPLKRAERLESFLSTKRKIYYKFEGANISGSHKLNTAIAQAYYYKNAGIKHLVTGTGAGQWGTALAYACKLFGLECTIFMVNASLKQKPQRKTLMELYGATLYASPSNKSKIGLQMLADNKYTNGSLGIATAEAIEYALGQQKANFAVGSGENHVLLHQTIVGNEALEQLKAYNDFPGKVYACMGAGSNFAGISLPLLRYKTLNSFGCEFIAVEPIACPKLTKGIYAIDINDFSGTTPYSKMYTLGSQYIAPPIHAGGLRYHGTSEFLSAMHHQGIIKSCAISEEKALSAGLLFAEHEGVLPAPESAYAIAAAIEDIKQQASNQSILINVSGHGFFDISAYEDYKANKLINDQPDAYNIENSLSELRKLNSNIIEEAI